MDRELLDKVEFEAKLPKLPKPVKTEDIVQPKESVRSSALMRLVLFIVFVGVIIFSAKLVVEFTFSFYKGERVDIGTIAKGIADERDR